MMNNCDYCGRYAYCESYTIWDEDLNKDIEVLFCELCKEDAENDSE